MSSREPENDFAWSAEELELLQAARVDAMPDALQRHMRDRFEQSVSGAHGQAAPAPSLRSSGLLGAKLALWGTLGLIALGTAAYLSARAWPTSPSAADKNAAFDSAMQPATAMAGAAPQVAEQSAQLMAAVGTHDTAVFGDDGAHPAAALRDGESTAQRLAAQGSRPGAAAWSAQETKLSAAASGTRMDAAARGGESTAKPLAALGARPAGAAPSAQATKLSAAAIRTRVDVAARDGESTVQLLAAQGERSGAAASSARETGGAHVAGPAARLLAANEVEHPSPTMPAPEAVAAEPATATDQLRVEAELLDGARRALSRGALSQAGQLLERYSAQFARGVLHPESDVLRIELQMRRGQPDAAKAEASRFLNAYPNHPLRERVRALIAAR